MKNFIKIILVITLNVIAVNSVNAQSIIWRQIIGEQYNESGKDVIELIDKGYLMVGRKQVEASGSMFLIYQTYLIKLDRFGNIEWQKIIGDSIFGNYSNAVTEDPFGNIYLPISPAHLIKMNSTGTILWDRDYSSTNILSFVGISFVDNYKNLMLVGSNEVSTTNTSSLTKIDSSGNLIWTKAYYDSIPSLYAYSSYRNCYLFLDDYYFLSGNIGLNGFIIKTDTSGNRIWTKIYTQSQYIMSIAQNSDNTFIATGSGRNFYTYCLKFDSSGDTIWTKNYNPVSFGIFKIAKTFNFNYVIGTIAGGNFTRIGIIDSSGNVLSIYENTYSQNVLMSQENLNPTSDSGLVLTGEYGIYQNGKNNQSVITDALIFKVDKFGNMVSINNNNNELISENFEVNTFPNPFNLSFTIDFKLSQNGKIKIELYEISGKKIKIIENKDLHSGNYKYLINTPELGSGIYFLRFNINKNVYSRKILLIK